MYIYSIIIIRGTRDTIIYIKYVHVHFSPFSLAWIKFPSYLVVKVGPHLYLSGSLVCLGLFESD